MSVNEKLNRTLAKVEPGSVFSSPLEIVEARLLTRGEKLATLERWRKTVLSEVDAANEGMPTYRASARYLALLENIEQARKSLTAVANSN